MKNDGKLSMREIEVELKKYNINTSMKLYTAFPRGYCAWVNRAIEMLQKIVEKYSEEIIYVNHEIIHNSFIITHFEKLGVVFWKNIQDIPENSIIMISAHGTGPEFMEKIRKRKLRYIDASCPLVIKVHTELKNFIKKGFQIIYIWKKGHQEAEGILEEDRKNIFIVHDRQDIDKISPLLSKQGQDGGLALLTQTTLSVQETQELIVYIQEKFPWIVLPAASDICYATTNRQRAVTKLSENSDCIIIVWSKNSSNSNKLRDLWEKLWKKSILIDNAWELDLDVVRDYENIWISSGASVPEVLVEEVIQKLESAGATFQEELKIVEENMVFQYNLALRY